MHTRYLAYRYNAHQKSHISGERPDISDWADAFMHQDGIGYRGIFHENWWWWW